MLARCLIVDDDPLPRERVRSLLSLDPRIGSVEECGSGSSALDMTHLNAPDLVFLDVRMPDMSGLEVAQQIMRVCAPAFVVISAYAEHALSAFDAAAADYLLKPISPDRFALALDRAFDRLARNGMRSPTASEPPVLSAAAQFSRRFVSRRGSASYFVDATDVQWIDSAGNYVQLHADGRVHFVRQSLTEVEQRLDPEKFARIHRRIIVNLDFVRRLESGSHGEFVVTMRDGSRITSSRTRSDRLRDLLR